MARTAETNVKAQSMSGRPLRYIHMISPVPHSNSVNSTVVQALTFRPRPSVSPRHGISRRQATPSTNVSSRFRLLTATRLQPKSCIQRAESI